MRIKSVFSVNGHFDALKILLAIIFTILVFVPLAIMFAYVDKETVLRTVGTPQFNASIVNSVQSSLIGTIVTIMLAFCAALYTERSGTQYKGLFSTLFVLPMLIPSISIGMGLIIVFGNNSPLAEFVASIGGLYGMLGIVVGSVIYAFPVAYLMFVGVMRHEDAAPHEAATILGLTPFQRFIALGYPYLKKPLISIIFAIFTLIVTDYGVPLMVGGKCTTIPVVMYHEVIGQLDFGQGIIYGSLLIIPAVIAFILDLFNRERTTSSFVPRAFTKNWSSSQRFAGTGLAIIISTLLFLPVFSFCILGFSTKYPLDITFTTANIAKVLSLRIDVYLLNSLTIASWVTIIGVAIAFITAYLTARMKSKTSRFLHISVITSAAIPGLVLGLAYVLAFKGSFLYGTLSILIMVNIVHFISSPYLMMYNNLSKMNANLEDIGCTLGIGRLRLIRDIFLPTCWPTLVEMAVYFFVNCMMTISAVSFLSNTSNKPISLMITRFEAQMQLECAAVVSLIILGVNLIIRSGAYWIRCQRNIK